MSGIIIVGEIVVEQTGNIVSKKMNITFFNHGKKWP